MFKNFLIFSMTFAFVFSPCISNLKAYEGRAICSLPHEQKVELKTLSTSTTLTQTALWLNEEVLAVGRWDGTITIFQAKEGLSILQVLVSPNKNGITMLEKINDELFVSSNSSSSIALWENGNDGYVLKDFYSFEEHFGSVDCAKFIEVKNHKILLTGHSEGYFLIWEFSENSFSLLSVINLQSLDPVKSPFKLLNLRSILLWKNESVITASEDGDLCIINVLEGKVIYRQRYNKMAQRGINHIFISGDYLLLSNCSVGPLDQNLWLYRIEKDEFVYLDSKNLIANKNLDQVFSFDVGIFGGDNVTVQIPLLRQGI